MLKDLEEKKQEKTSLLKEIEKYRECDPEVLELVRKQTGEAKEAANRWTGSFIQNGLSLYICSTLCKKTTLS